MICVTIDSYIDSLFCLNNEINNDNNIEAVEEDVINKIKSATSIDEVVEIISDELSTKIMEQLTPQK